MSESVKMPLGGSNGTHEVPVVGLSQVFEECRQVARARIILVTGETGTGKELIAGWLHQNGPRKDKQLVVVNAGAIPDALADSELFGHEKGAFTGAINQRHGLLEHAHEGTIFLDEIGNISLELQAKILRVLEDGMVRQVGSNKAAMSDFHVIAATNKDLGSLVKEGKFREDLLYRLNSVHIKLPPLRARDPNEVYQLAANFADHNESSPCMIDSDAGALIMNYPWPGNVRELKGSIERACMMRVPGSRVITPSQLPEDVRQYIPNDAVGRYFGPPSKTGIANDLVALARMLECGDEGVIEQLVEKHGDIMVFFKAVEAALITDVMRRRENNKTEVAGLLGLNRTTLLAKLKTIAERGLLKE